MKENQLGSSGMRKKFKHRDEDKIVGPSTNQLAWKKTTSLEQQDPELEIESRHGWFHKNNIVHNKYHTNSITKD
jgi:hypothetical protein